MKKLNGLTFEPNYKIVSFDVVSNNIPCVNVIKKHRTKMKLY